VVEGVDVDSSVGQTSIYSDPHPNPQRISYRCRPAIAAVAAGAVVPPWTSLLSGNSRADFRFRMKFNHLITYCCQRIVKPVIVTRTFH
jgi:hypothetical protein